MKNMGCYTFNIFTKIGRSNLINHLILIKNNLITKYQKNVSFSPPLISFITFLFKIYFFTSKKFTK